MKVRVSLFLVACLVFLLIQPASANPGELYFVDAHSQVDDGVKPLRKVIALMQEAGVKHTILSTRGRLQGKSLLLLAKQSPGRITPAVRTKGGAYEKSAPQYFKQLKAQAASGRYGGMAEVLLYHAQKGDKAPKVEVFPDDRRVLAALAQARKNGWPFVIHIEFAALQGVKRQRFQEMLQRMLEANRGTPFVLTHMGQLPAAEVRQLIEAHANLHFHTGWTNPAAVRSSRQPWVNLFEGYRLAPEWRDLFLRHPDRFIFALDNVFAEHWSDFYLEQMSYWKEALADLPADVAHAVAHANAERLWGITP